MKKLIVVADWSNDSLACQEFSSAVEGFIKNPDQIRITFIHSTPSTVHTAFLIKQTALTEERLGRPLETVIFQNCDPRLGLTKTGDKIPGAQPLIIKLKSGIFITGPNARNNFSLIKDDIDEAFSYQDLDKGSQFRSRDLYSRICAHLMDAQEDEMELDEIHLSSIPILSEYYVGHVDNFGNIKTTIRYDQLREKFAIGDKVPLRINGHENKAVFTSSLFSGEPDQLVIYPGSSGYRDNPYIEISVWSSFIGNEVKTGSFYFSHPKPGQAVSFI